MAASTEIIEERMYAYIRPNRPEGEAQELAFRRAVAAQEAYEQSLQEMGLPGGVKSVKLGELSITLSDGTPAAPYCQDTISPAAWSILFNAGLLGRSWPTARRYNV